jgi:hypothetical protein
MSPAWYLSRAIYEPCLIPVLSHLWVLPDPCLEPFMSPAWSLSRAIYEPCLIPVSSHLWALPDPCLELFMSPVWSLSWGILTQSTPSRPVILRPILTLCVILYSNLFIKFKITLQAPKTTVWPPEVVFTFSRLKCVRFVIWTVSWLRR